MNYYDVLMVSIIAIAVLRPVFLVKRYGKKKGDLIAATLLLCTLPLILLTDAGETMSSLFKGLLIAAAIINWIYSLYDYKFRKDK